MWRAALGAALGAALAADGYSSSQGAASAWAPWLSQQELLPAADPGLPLLWPQSELALPILAIW